MPSALLQIGVITRPHALRGQLRVRLHNSASCALGHVRSVWLKRETEGGGEPDPGQAWNLEMAQPLPDGCYLVQLAGVSDRTTAEALQGTKVYVQRDELDALDEDEVYLADLPGMLVRTVAGEELGRISKILDLNGNTLLCIAGLMGAEFLLPAVPQVLRSVDMVGGIVVVDPPDGLLNV